MTLDHSYTREMRVELEGVPVGDGFYNVDSDWEIEPGWTADRHTPGMGPVADELQFAAWEDETSRPITDAAILAALRKRAEDEALDRFEEDDE